MTRPALSTLRLGWGPRLGIAVVTLAGLWLAVAWAMG